MRAFREGSIWCRSQVCREARTGMHAECSSKADARSCRSVGEGGLAVQGSPVMFILWWGSIGAGSLLVGRMTLVDLFDFDQWVSVTLLRKHTDIVSWEITFSIKRYKEMATSLLYCSELFHADFFYKSALYELIPFPRSFLPWFPLFLSSQFTYIFIPSPNRYMY